MQFTWSEEALSLIAKQEKNKKIATKRNDEHMNNLRVSLTHADTALPNNLLDLVAGYTGLSDPIVSCQETSFFREVAILSGKCPATFEMSQLALTLLLKIIKMMKK